MSNQDYIIQTEKIDLNPNPPAIDTPKSNTSVSEGVNFKVKTGFENLASAPPFSILLSSNLVNFGTLTPTNPIIRTVDLSIDSQKTYGYSVLVFENEPLSTIPPASKTSIPDTTCDSGTCGIENADLWSNTLTYGFGYRCDNVTGTDCDSSFAKANFYKHFPDIAGNDDLAPIMAGIGANSKVARISYKVNISGTQAQGTYSNIITYIAVPNF